MTLKYITFLDSDDIPHFVMFPHTLQHANVWRALRRELLLSTPLGAGFVTLRAEGAFPMGRSDSLDLAVHADDHDILNTNPK